MDPRYENTDIIAVWLKKFQLWQRSELAALRARVKARTLSRKVYNSIRRKLLAHPIDVAWIKDREKKTIHDLEAFLDERRRWLTKEEAAELHKDMTSYDTEEPATNEMLIEAFAVCSKFMPELFEALGVLAQRYRYTPMLANTHGQPAEIQSFGKMVLCWYQDINDAWDIVCRLSYIIRRSKMSWHDRQLRRSGS